MHAVFISVALDDYDKAKAHLQAQIVPQVKQAPGFVAGYWANVQRERGRGIMVFESEEAAQSVADMLSQFEGDGATLEGVEVAEVDASA